MRYQSFKAFVNLLVYADCQFIFPNASFNLGIHKKTSVRNYISPDTLYVKSKNVS